ncbi:MAG: cation:proton antiporter [Bdellovibrionales bacterium]|nr:cation:proton antiporter [Bdellovibrionales bacterium]
MNVITHLLLLLAGARLFGRFFKAIGFSTIMGEILAGLLLGPTIFNAVMPSKELNGIIDLGIFLMIFAAGLEMDLQDIFGAIRKKALLCSLSGFIFSFLAGLGIGHFWGLPFLSSTILGLCFSITALPIVIRFMNNYNLIDTKMGHAIMGASVILDVFALLFLGVILNVQHIQHPLVFFKIISSKMAGMVLFFIIVMLVNKFLRSELLSTPQSKNIILKLVSYLGEEAIFGAGVVFVLLFSTATEALGFHFIIGAFFGGLLLNKDIIGVGAFDSMTKTLNSITDQFLTPIFFASIGLYFSIEAFDQPALLLSVMGVAYLSKIVGSGIGAKWVGFNTRESSRIGIALNSRGTLDLIVAEIAFSKGYVDSKIFSILICTSLASLIINPMLYRQTIKKGDDSGGAQGQT